MRVEIIDGQISMFDTVRSVPRGLLGVGDLIGRRVLGEVQIARITKIEGLPDYPFYRTDSGCCYTVDEGHSTIAELEQQAAAVREKYETITPKNLSERITWEHTKNGKTFWAQIGITGNALYWKDFMTYQFLEPCASTKELKRAYIDRKKEIEWYMKINNYENLKIVQGEHLMSRLYKSAHGFYASAKYVEVNG